MAKKTNNTTTKNSTKKVVKAEVVKAPIKKLERLEGVIDMYKSVKASFKIPNWFTKTSLAQRKAIFDRVKAPTITISDFYDFGKSTFGSINIPIPLMENLIKLLELEKVTISPEWIHDPNKQPKSADKEKKAIAKLVNLLASKEREFAQSKVLVQIAKAQPDAINSLMLNDAKLAIKEYNAIKASIPKTELPKLIKGQIRRLSPSGSILGLNQLCVKKLGVKADLTKQIAHNKYVKTVSESLFKDYFLKNPKSAIKMFVPSLEKESIQVVKFVELTKQAKVKARLARLNKA